MIKGLIKRFKSRIIPETAVFLAPLLLGNIAIADDTAWVRRVKDCREFEQQMADYYKRAGDPLSWSSAQQKELQVILDEACGPRFQNCNFEVCVERKATREKFLSGGTESKQATSTETLAPLIITNPLAWLKQPLDCEGFKEQISARYSPLGSKMSELNEQKRKELAYVLDVACSPRFVQCNFKNCARDEQGKKESVAQKSEGLNGEENYDVLLDSQESIQVLKSLSLEQRRELAAAELRKLFEEELSNRQRLIAERVAEEREKGLTWEPFQMPDVAARLSVEKEEERPAKKNYLSGPPTGQASTPSSRRRKALREKTRK